MRPLWMFVIIPFGIAAASANAVARDAGLNYDQVEFSVQAEEELPNDLAEVVLAAQSEHAEPAQVAKDINETMTWALGQVHVVTGHRVIGWSSVRAGAVPFEVRDRTADPLRADQELASSTGSRLCWAESIRPQLFHMSANTNWGY